VPRPKVYDEDLRERLIARAAAMIAESGLAHLALRQVAAAEGTSTSAIYSMFEDRAGLVHHVGHTASLGFVAAQRAVPMTDDPLVDVFNLGLAYRGWALEHPALYLVLMTPDTPELRLNGPLPESEAADAIRDPIVRLIDTGVFPPVDPNMLLGIVWSSVHGFVSLELAGYFTGTSREQRDHMYEAQLNSITRGWRTRL
jgi:AcrR family transcriptional regulator